MNEILEYVLRVVVVPALIGAGVAMPFVLKPFRRRAMLLEAAAACAVCVAFLASFVSELDRNAVLRQVMAIEGDSAPFERWHRVGLAALVLAVAAWVVAFARARLGLGRAVTIVAAVAATALAGTLVEFPAATARVQIAQAALVLGSIVAFGVAGSAALWAAWSVFGAMAVLAALGGFASLAVMCGAASLGAFLTACCAALGGRLDRSAAPFHAVGAVVIAFGALAGLVARCGIAYDTNGIPAWAWVLAALSPAGGAIFSRRATAALRPGAKTFWRFLGIALVAIAVLAAAALVQSRGRAADAGDGSDDMDMYGSGSGSASGGA